MNCSLFSDGFRPMFLASGLAALLLIPAWVAVLAFGIPVASDWPPSLWHAHEMLFGFVAAAVAGFLLTAVPSWTASRAFTGAPLVALLALWISARVLVASAAYWPAVLVMAVDVGFVLMLAALVAPRLLRARNRNTALLAVLGLLLLCNGAFHWALIRRNPAAASHALLIAIDIMLLLVTVIGGRIVPAFTANALRASNSPAQLRAWPGVDRITIASMVAVALIDVLWPHSVASGICAALAALAQAMRLLQWRGEATLKQPILWVLHVGYAWLPLGLFLKSASLLGGFAAAAFWLHALTVGVIATMVLGVMTRAALGHTGRPLVAARSIALSYGLLLLAGLSRVFGLSILGLDYLSVILISACLWTAAFAIFVFVYGPMLWLPRVGGKAG